MNARLRFGMGVLAVVVLTPAVLLCRRPPDPMFEGRFASQWAEDLLSPDYSTRNDAQAAFLALGKEGVPQIQVLLQKRNGPWEPAVLKLNRWLPFLNYKTADAVLCQQRGAEMVLLLGANAQAAIPDLVRCLATDGSAPEAERALLKAGALALPGLNRGLSSRQAEIRRRTAKLLAEFESLPPETIAALIRRERDSEPAVRRQVAHTLGRVTAEGNRAERIAALQSLAVDRAPEVRAAAIEGLGRQYREGGVKIVAAIRQALTDPAVAVRLEAGKALWHIHRDAPAVLPVLTPILSTQEGWQAAYALAEMGPSAAPAVPELALALRREKVPRPFRTPPSCAFALGQIGPPAIPALRSMFADRDAVTRLNAVLAVGFMGKRGTNAISGLLPLLEDPDAEVRHATALTLATIGAGREQVLPGLTACLNAEDIYMRSAAAQALRQIAPEGNWVVNPE